MPYILPLDFDPPRHRVDRIEVNPHLAPGPMAVLEDAIRDVADELIDTFIGQGSCDIAQDFARRLPGTVFFRLIVGEGDDEFRRVEPSARALSFDRDPAKKGEAAGVLLDWASNLLGDRAAHAHSPDVVEAVRHLGEDGTTFAPQELYSGLQILAMGGIGTSADLIGAVVCMLSADRGLQQRVRGDLTLVPALVEEALRLEPPVTMMFRTATRDVTIAGKQIRQGQRVGLFFGAANRDPAVFERPNDVDIDRAHNPHLAFGAGVHRCVGSNLARLQVRIAVEQLLTRLAPFAIPDGARVEYTSDQERGPSSLPLTFPPGEPRVS
jgi:cytochrome P450